MKNGSTDLTTQQARILGYIEDHDSDEAGLTVRQIQTDLGYGSTCSPQAILQVLERKGYIQRNRGANGKCLSRGIRSTRLYRVGLRGRAAEVARNMDLRELEGIIRGAGQ